MQLNLPNLFENNCAAPEDIIEVMRNTPVAEYMLTKDCADIQLSVEELKLIKEINDSIDADMEFDITTLFEE